MPEETRSDNLTRPLRSFCIEDQQEQVSRRKWQEIWNYLMFIADQKLGDELRRKVGVSDIVQQSLIDVQVNIKSFQGDEQALRAWLKKLVQNNVTDAWRYFCEAGKRDVRREQAYQTNELIDPDQLTASSICRHREADEQLLDAVASLSPRRRQVITLRHQKNLAFDEIADVMDTSEGAARRMYSRAVEKLRQNLNPRG